MRQMNAHRLGVVLLVFAALAVAPQVGLAQPASTATGPLEYVGSTSQGLPVELVATPTGVTSFIFFWRARCDDGLIHANEIDASSRSATPVDGKGRFSMSGVLNTGGLFQIRGRIGSGHASGRLSRHGPTAFGTDCRTATLKWHAFPIG
jgi:hypothetical protein